MQKILRYEMAVALKDRPKFFRCITAVLFSFSVTIIVVNTVIRLSGAGQPKQAYKPAKNPAYAGIVAAPAGRVLHFKK